MAQAGSQPLTHSTKRKTVAPQGSLGQRQSARALELTPESRLPVTKRL